MFCGHLFQQRRSVVLIHHVDAVTDALGMALLHRLTNVKAQPLRRDLGRGELAGVERDVHLRVHGMEVVNHIHLQCVVPHGYKTVFRHHEVDAYKSRLFRVHAGLHRLEAQ